VNIRPCGEWRAHGITVLRQQLETRTDPVIQALLAEVMAYPAPRGGAAPAINEGPQRFATPLQVATRFGAVRCLNTPTIFGTPTDVTLAELALDMLFPADEPTVAIVQSMVEEDSARQRAEAALQKAG
jgi:hypothetical protein